MSSPSISVVIPAHDRAHVLPRSLGSVLGQTVAPLEVIVVDDGSTDETERVAREFGVRYVRLDRRSGAQAARNRGIAEARGEWIAFQDSDDEWLPDKLERQVALIEDEWTVVHGRAQRPIGGLLENEQDALRTLLSRPATLFPALLASRAALERIGPLDEELPAFQEWDTSLRLARYCRFVAPEEPVFIYHEGGGDTISASNVNDVRGYLHVIEKHRGEMDAETWEEHLRFLTHRAFDFRLWDEARRLLERSEKRDARWRAYMLCARLGVHPRYVARLRSAGWRAARAGRSRLRRRRNEPWSESFLARIETGDVSFEEIRARAIPYPAELFAGRESALVLFGAAFLGINDAIHAAEAGLPDVTVVDIDAGRLATMRALYPGTWRFVAADAFAYAEEQHAAGARYDIVCVDPFTTLMARCRASLPVYCALARHAVVFGIQPGVAFEEPPGWRSRRIERSEIADWIVLERA